MNEFSNLDYVIKAFIKLGGSGKLIDIYDEVKYLIPLEKLNSYKSLKSFNGTISKTIEDNSKDSMNYKKYDLFKKIGSGKWEFTDKYQKSLEIMKRACNIRDVEIIDFDYFLDSNELCFITKKDIHYVMEWEELALFSGKISDSKISLVEDIIEINYKTHNNKEVSVNLKYTKTKYNKIMDLYHRNTKK
ncbi:MAG: hypothetical protein RBR50_08085 [Candidatus Izemoplasmatales bacterium]|jgi:hypothetical protein|nr:hypothetical protein [Candidatus Izemoplasmatales bacterium]